MFRNHRYTWHTSERSRLPGNYRWFVFAGLTLLLVVKQPSKAQTAQTTPTAQVAEAAAVTVTGEPVPTPTPHDNWREMRQHIMPEVSGTQITVTKKATVIKLDEQPPLETICGKPISTPAGGLTSTNCWHSISIPAGLTAAIQDG